MTDAAGVPYTEAWLTGPANTPFYTRTYAPPTPPRGVLVFVHGFIEHIGRYVHVHPPWAKRGFVVLAFDQRGFGRTALDKKGTGWWTYGRTNQEEAVRDIEWAISVASERYGRDVPVFLMGHSMGGALVLSFVTRTTAPPEKATIGRLAGVISTSPLLHLVDPPNSLLRWAGGKLRTVLPNLIFPASVNNKYLSHDPAIMKDQEKDPLVRRYATLQCLDDMLDRGDNVVARDYEKWPKNLPLLLVHGTDDKITRFDTSEEFFKEVPAKDKTFTPYLGGYHELQNEPNGVSQKLCEECISWAEAHLPPTEPTPANLSLSGSKL